MRTPSRPSRARVSRSLGPLYEFHRSNGIEIAEAPSDKPWHIRDYTGRDLDGNYLIFGKRPHETEPSRSNASLREE